MCYIETMETYLVLKCQAVKRHGRILLHITSWKKPIWKGYVHTIQTTWRSGKDKTRETVKRLMVLKK